MQQFRNLSILSVFTVKLAWTGTKQLVHDLQTEVRHDKHADETGYWENGSNKLFLLMVPG